MPPACDGAAATCIERLNAIVLFWTMSAVLPYAEMPAPGPLREVLLEIVELRTVNDERRGTVCAVARSFSVASPPPPIPELFVLTLAMSELESSSTVGSDVDV